MRLYRNSAIREPYADSMVRKLGNALECHSGAFAKQIESLF